MKMDFRQNLRWISILFLLILILSACTEKTVLTKIPLWAENSLMTTEGRLFVSGAFNIYEITKNDDGTFEHHELYNGTGTFMGIAQHGEYIYIILNGNEIQDKFLLVAHLDALTLDAKQNDAVFTKISLADHILPEFGDDTFILPNGMGIDSRNYIYITDEQAGRIMRFHISNDDPTVVEDLEVWIDEGADTPNGVAINGDTFYFTNCFQSEIKKVAINEDGTPGEVKIFHTRIFPNISILDDMTIFKDGVMVASCGEGRVFYVTDPGDEGDEGEVLFQTTPEVFLIATSVCIGRPPMFEENDIIVTEGGGGRVSLVKYNP